MEIIISPTAKKDLEYWKKTGNVSVMKKIDCLIADIIEHPFTGLGKPELLKHELAGCWSRRINSEHRLVYRVEKENVIVYIVAARSHYGN